MTYYPTLEEDLKRAKEIVERGKAQYDLWANELRMCDPNVERTIIDRLGGAIYPVDNYAAYKLLESFVAEIEKRVEAPGERDAAALTPLDSDGLPCACLCHQDVVQTACLHDGCQPRISRFPVLSPTVHISTNEDTFVCDLGGYRISGPRSIQDQIKITWKGSQPPS